MEYKREGQEGGRKTELKEWRRGEEEDVNHRWMDGVVALRVKSAIPHYRFEAAAGSPSRKENQRQHSVRERARKRRVRRRLCEGEVQCNRRGRLHRLARL